MRGSINPLEEQVAQYKAALIRSAITSSIGGLTTLTLASLLSENKGLTFALSCAGAAFVGSLIGTAYTAVSANSRYHEVMDAENKPIVPYAKLHKSVPSHTHTRS